MRLYAYRRDQYSRAVATVYVRKWFLKRDASLELLKRGLAVVYEANTGAEFGKWEKRYRNVESQAKTKRIGIWADKHGETPGEYKKRMAADIESKAGVKEENTKEDRKWFRWWWR